MAEKPPKASKPFKSLEKQRFRGSRGRNRNLRQKMFHNALVLASNGAPWTPFPSSRRGHNLTYFSYVVIFLRCPFSCSQRKKGNVNVKVFPLLGVASQAREAALIWARNLRSRKVFVAWKILRCEPVVGGSRSDRKLTKVSELSKSLENEVSEALIARIGI